MICSFSKRKGRRNMGTKAKNRIFPIVTACLLFVLMIASTIQTFAAVNNDSVVDFNKKGTLYIDYAEDTEGEDAVVGAEFTIYKIANLGSYGQFIPIIEGFEEFTNDTDVQAVLKAAKSSYERDPSIGYKYTAKTGSDGKAVISGIEIGLYIAEESNPADKHFSSIPFFVSLPNTSSDGTSWVYEVTAYPKSLPAGDLQITKTVTGDAGDTTFEFHFVVELKNYSDEVDYKKSDGSTGKIKSGGTITLKHGEQVTILNIPVGTEYSVTETEANQNGYTTTATGTEGGIMRTKISTAAFVNNKKRVLDTGDNDTALIALGIALGVSCIGLFLYSKLNDLKDKK